LNVFIAQMASPLCRCTKTTFSPVRHKVPAQHRYVVPLIMLLNDTQRAYKKLICVL